jgi:hypothetical protein
MALGDTVGDIIRVGDWAAVCLLVGVTQDSEAPAPSALADGVSVNTLLEAFGGRIPEDVMLVLASRSGSGTLSGSWRLWEGFGTLAGRHATGLWCPADIGPDATKGIINAGSAIGESLSDKVRHCERINVTAAALSVALQGTGIVGTSPVFDAWITGRKGH